MTDKEAAYEARMRYLELLEGSSEAIRTQLLSAEDYDELTELFCLCHDDYGNQTDVFRTLARVTWEKTPCDVIEPARWQSLMDEDGVEMTAKEKAAGWHWCREYDGLLVGPGMDELKHCRCLVPEHPMYKAVPAE